MTDPTSDGAMTDAEGRFRFPYLKIGSYEIVASLSGFRDASRQMTLTAGAAYELPLVLNYFPVLTGKGYAVLRPNYRGSSGYGYAFYRDVNNGYFNNMTADVMSGVDHMVKTGIADPDRLIAMGCSNN